MKTEFEILMDYRRAKFSCTKIGFRVPKNPESTLAKMKESDRWNLKNITKVFNQSWYMIDPYQYFLCGFEVFGNRFRFHQFMDPRIYDIHQEKQQSKNKKLEFIVDRFRKSYTYMKNFMQKFANSKNLSIFIQYVNIYDEKDRRILFQHYEKQLIDKYFLTWLIAKKFVPLTETDKSFQEKYRQYLSDIIETKIIPI